MLEELRRICGGCDSAIEPLVAARAKFGAEAVAVTDELCEAAADLASEGGRSEASEDDPSSEVDDLARRGAAAADLTSRPAPPVAGCGGSET